MLARNAELEALRELVIKRNRDATKKVSRLRRVSGVEIAGTKYDVRIRPAKIRKMNTRDATRLLKRLDEFMERSNAFVPLADMRPIPAHKWRQYKRAEAKNMELGRRYLDSVSDVKLPGGETVGEYRARNTLVGSQRMGHLQGNKIFIDRPRSSENIRGVKALDRLIKNVERKNAPEYTEKAHAKLRKDLGRMFKEGGFDPKLIKAVRGLSKYQLDVLWNHTKFAYKAGEHYFFMKNDDIKSTTPDADRERELHEMVIWASTLEEPATARKARPRVRK